MSEIFYYELFYSDFTSFSTSSPRNVFQICCVCVETKKSVLTRFSAVWLSRTLKLASLFSYNRPCHGFRSIIKVILLAKIMQSAYLCVIFLF